MLVSPSLAPAPVWLAAGIAVAAVLVACPATAIAAVRQCMPTVAASGTHPQSEAEARRIALEQWVVAASIHGEGFTRWQLAERRSLTCSRAAGGFLCQAVGLPCIISQTPEKPSPRAPQPPLGPGKKPTDA